MEERSTPHTDVSLNPEPEGCLLRCKTLLPFFPFSRSFPLALFFAAKPLAINDR